MQPPQLSVNVDAKGDNHNACTANEIHTEVLNRLLGTRCLIAYACQTSMQQSLQHQIHLIFNFYYLKPLSLSLLQIMDTPRPEQVRTMQPSSEDCTIEEEMELMEMILGALGRDAIGLGAR